MSCSIYIGIEPNTASYTRDRTWKCAIIYTGCDITQIPENVIAHYAPVTLPVQRGQCHFQVSDLGQHPQKLSVTSGNRRLP